MAEPFNARPEYGHRPMPVAKGWFVYVVRCNDGSLYTGITTDVGARVATHSAGKGAAYTRARRPVELVFWARARTMSSALKRELRLKALSRDEKLRLVASRPLRPPPVRRATKTPAAAGESATRRRR